jgi:hypothetical protein
MIERIGMQADFSCLGFLSSLLNKESVFEEFDIFIKLI